MNTQRPTPTVLGRVTGLGSSLPSRIMSNADFASYLDTTDEWIHSRTGIDSRHIGGSTTTLAIDAGAKALAASGVDPAHIDLTIVATTTPDQTMPAVSAHLQRELSLGGGGFDLNAACVGFTYGLAAGFGSIATGSRHVLVIGADTMSRHVDWDDRTTCVLFGDGAGAAVLSASSPASLEGNESGLLGLSTGSEGDLHDALFADHGDTVKMRGREVYRNAVRAVVDSSNEALHRAGMTAADIDLVVPHQANLRIIEAFSERLQIDSDRIVVNLDHLGNTSSASIPLALDEASGDGRLSSGDLVLLTGFGAGMTWASMVVRW